MNGIKGIQRWARNVSWKSWRMPTSHAAFLGERAAVHPFLGDRRPSAIPPRRCAAQAEGDVIGIWILTVIACDKREAFAQGSDSDEAIHNSASGEVDCFASLAMTRRRDRMHIITLDGETDFDGWRKAARALALKDVKPSDVTWRV